MSKIFKFGGASVKSTEEIINLKNIVLTNEIGLSVIVVSAIDKTTNKLEEVYKYFKSGDQKSALQKTRICIDTHYKIIEGLSLENNNQFKKHFNSLTDELLNFIGANKKIDNEQCYSKIVSYGELWSTSIISYYLKAEGINNQWLDARKVIKTTGSFVEGKVNWQASSKQIKNSCSNDIISVTQGFIASNSNNEVTTLGREGSDFSAAIFAWCLDSQEVLIWKDVDGLLNADPKWFKQTEVLSSISFKEAVELSYLGASVIHPNTIKPLQNKNINLRIKSFLNPSLSGTLISEIGDNDGQIPSFIYKPNQILISISTKDYSYVFEEHISEIFGIFSSHGFKVHLMQNSALSFSVCGIINSHELSNLINVLQENYKVRFNEKVDLITVRHYNNTKLPDFLMSKEVILSQKTRNTLRFVLKND